jgi:broad specificity phosphatase PhoE
MPSSTDPRLPQVYLARHGATAWTVAGRHTGRTDLPLTAEGAANARRLGQRLQGLSFARVLTSPLQRAAQTCELTGFRAVARSDGDLMEWDYGDYEGKTSAEIQRLRPGWDLFRAGCPGGESVADVGTRAERVLARIRAFDGHTLIFSHGHFLRVFTARWLALDAAAGHCFYLGTAALSILGYEYDRGRPVIALWNDCGHALAAGRPQQALEEAHRARYATTAR